MTDVSQRRRHKVSCGLTLGSWLAILGLILAPTVTVSGILINMRIQLAVLEAKLDTISRSVAYADSQRENFSRMQQRMDEFERRLQYRERNNPN